MFQKQKTNPNVWNGGEKDARKERAGSRRNLNSSRTRHKQSSSDMLPYIFPHVLRFHGFVGRVRRVEGAEDQPVVSRAQKEITMVRFKLAATLGEKCDPKSIKPSLHLHDQS